MDKPPSGSVRRRLRWRDHRPPRTPDGSGRDTRNAVRRPVAGATVQPGLVSWCRRMPSAHASHPGRGASGEGRACHRWIPALPPRESPTRTPSSSSGSATAADASAGRSCMTRCAPSRGAACSAGYGADDLAAHRDRVQPLRHAGAGRPGVRDRRRGAGAPPTDDRRDHARSSRCAEDIRATPSSPTAGCGAERTARANRVPVRLAAVPAGA